MLTKFWLQNFKCFRNLGIEPKLITVLIGPNGSGKSSTLQALMLLKQSLGQTNLSAQGRYVNLGQFGDVVHGGNERNVMKIGFEGRRQAELPSVPIEIAGDTQLRYEVTIAHGAVRGVDLRLQIDGLLLDRTGFHFKGLPFHLRLPREEVGLGFHFGGLAELPKGPDPEKVAQEAAEFVDSVSGLFQDYISRLFLVPAIRGFARPEYALTDNPVQNFVSDGPQDLASTFAYKRELESKVSAWYERITGVRMAFLVKPQRQVNLEIPGPLMRINIVNEGFGTNQLAWLLGQMAVAPDNSLVGIEEPEIHLHPRAQAKLVEVLLEVAQGENKQIWLTTHSEHILFALLTAVAKGVLKREDLAVYAFQKEEGAASAAELRVDERGRVEGGLRGFFEAEVEQLDAYMKALFGKE